MTTMNKSYTELLSYKTFDERVEYLALPGTVAGITFGHNRFLNQKFYSLPEWKIARRNVIIRDNGFDLGIDGLIIAGLIVVHHINPITVDDILNRNPILFDPENLISCSDNTHKAIHYNIKLATSQEVVDRKPYDTCPWKL